MDFISEIYADETRYASKIRDKLSNILGVSLSEEENQDRTSPDGVYAVQLTLKQIPIFSLEFKR